MYINIERIEFTVTDACSGNCKHCSNGGHRPNRGSVDADAAVAAVEQLVERYQVKSLMTFGGEPLLYAETTCRIHAAARDNGIPIRQIITNGFFSRDERREWRKWRMPFASRAQTTFYCLSMHFTRNIYRLSPSCILRMH